MPVWLMAGLKECHWPGRCQILEREGVSYFLDGAHTNKSLLFCAEWFQTMSAKDAASYK